MTRTRYTFPEDSGIIEPITAQTIFELEMPEDLAAFAGRLMREIAEAEAGGIDEPGSLGYVGEEGTPVTVTHRSQLEYALRLLEEHHADPESGFNVFQAYAAAMADGE